ncbi:MAG: hypothetical protein ACT4P4_15830 [Betaproteobacteria bacterium]
MATIHKPFTYVPAIQTNIARTIQRERKRLKALEDAAKKQVPVEVAVVTNVTPLPTGKLRNGKA